MKASAYGGVAGAARADEEAEVLHPLLSDANIYVHQLAGGVPAWDQPDTSSESQNRPQQTACSEGRTSCGQQLCRRPRLEWCRRPYELVPLSLYTVKMRRVE